MSTYRPGGFQILPPVIKNLLIINVLVFAITNLGGERVTNFMMMNFCLFPFNTEYFKPWQLVTHIFMHADFTHLLFNMLGLWMFGKEIESIFGTVKFALFYFACGIGAALFSWAAYALIDPNHVSISLGASGAIYGILLAFGYMFPNAVVLMSFIFPIKAKYMVAIFAAVQLFDGLARRPGDTVGHFAHLGGMVIAFILLKIWNPKRPTNYY